MSVSVVQSAAHTTSNTVTFPSNVTAGNLIVIFASRNNGLNNPCNPTDNQGNVWTQVVWSNAGGGAFPNNMACCWTVASVSGSLTVQVFTASCVTGIELSGATSTVDAFGSGTGTTAPTLTASKANDALLTGVVYTGSNAPTVTSPETVLQTTFGLDGGNVSTVAFTTVASAGSVTSSLVPGSPSSNQTYVTVLFEAQTGISATARGITQCSGSVVSASVVGALGQASCSGAINAAIGTPARGVALCSGSAMGTITPTKAQGIALCSGSIAAVSIFADALGQATAQGFATTPIAGSTLGCITETSAPAGGGGSGTGGNRVY